MQLGFLKLSPDERHLFFEQAAIQRGLSPVIMEKDFWVSWMLGVLFTSRFAAELVFKGGTSLSKVFGVAASSLASPCSQLCSNSRKRAK